MPRSMFVPAILMLAMAVGCGESKPVDRGGGAYEPVAQPPDQASTDKQPGPALIKESAPDTPPPEATQAEPTADGEAAAGEPATPTSEEMPEEKETTPEETAEKAAGVATDSEPDHKPEATDDVEKATPRRSSKLLRGLGSRALSKAAGADQAGEVRPAPDLADDPFPNGEPVENNKSKGQAE